MRLYDEVSRELRTVEIHSRMGLYVCGITPYDASHIGHAFTYVQFDALVRYLRHLGTEVIHVQNITDVDDDILRTAGERGVGYRELAEVETRAFEEAMGRLNVTPPTHSPLASEFVPEIVEEVQGLLSAGRAYEREGTVYFRVRSDPGYGRLSQLTRDEMLEVAAERGGRPDDPAKDDPLDFVLWQGAAPGEPVWESPWGRGRPGWHIECSTMARRLLGQPVDVHGGGADLVFPHHESELAQAEGLPGEKPFVRHWVHSGVVYLGGEKMSKSLGNLVFVADLLERYRPEVIRSLLLRRHYRHDWEFREEDLEELSGTGPLMSNNEGEDARPGRAAPEEAREAFFRALDEDLDTPAAMRILDRAASLRGPAWQDLLEEGSNLLGIDATS